MPKRRDPSLLIPQSFGYICSMNFEAFLHFQEKHRAFLEEESIAKNAPKLIDPLLPENPNPSQNPVAEAIKKDTP